MRTDSILRAATVGAPLVAAGSLLFLSSAYLSGAVITVAFDDNAGGKHNAATGLGAIGDANRGDPQVFTSRGFAGGSLLKNSTTVPITDLHLDLTDGSTFAAASTGGAAFPNAPVFNAAKTSVDFTGGNIPVGASFWSQIPLSANFGAGGVGAYTGYATPQKPKPAPPAPKLAPVGPETGTSTGMTYNSSTSNITVTTAADNIVKYQNGTSTTSDNPTESIIGSQLSVTGLQLLSTTANPDGSYNLSDGILSITQGSSVYLDATLADAVIIPDHSVAGNDSLLQATLIFPTFQSGLTSEFLNEYYNDLGPGDQGVFNFRTSLLTATNNFAQNGSSSGNILLGDAIPEPATASILLAGLSAASLGRGRRNKKRG